MAERCSFCGVTSGPFSKVEGLFPVLMCADCQAWLERQAQAAEELIGERRAQGRQVDQRTATP
jgi:hypothetical protein